MQRLERVQQSSNPASWDALPGCFTKMQAESLKFTLFALILSVVLGSVVAVDSLLTRHAERSRSELLLKFGGTENISICLFTFRL